MNYQVIGTHSDYSWNMEPVWVREKYTVWNATGKNNVKCSTWDSCVLLCWYLWLKKNLGAR